MFLKGVNTKKEVEKINSINDNKPYKWASFVVFNCASDQDVVYQLAIYWLFEISKKMLAVIMNVVSPNLTADSYNVYELWTGHLTPYNSQDMTRNSPKWQGSVMKDMFTFTKRHDKTNYRMIWIGLNLIGLNTGVLCGGWVVTRNYWLKGSWIWPWFSVRFTWLSYWFHGL